MFFGRYENIHWVVDFWISLDSLLKFTTFITLLKGEIKAEKERVKKLEIESRQKTEKLEKKEKEIYAKCNTVIVELCKNIRTKFLEDDPKFARFVTNLEVFYYINFFYIS